ncbi:glucosaminidase domain-containing protein [Paenibacillus sp. DMB20]|uniref:glucosaminidase domain-containing protein n=1 Tax=Paenibacillus sp. DMB20 TaxID=1642570 RepID=UPI00069C2306|nr:glucosaminidase domain-containing protein [Paenibacillus sp. DMB20]
MNQTLSGALKGKGDAFAAAGKKYGIDPALLAAIAIHETGNGSSNAVRKKNNVGGMMGKNGLMTFGSVDEGIDRMASNLKRLYFDQGLTTIPQIQKKYAPVGASNDPTGLNNHWVSGVTRYYRMLGGS